MAGPLGQYSDSVKNGVFELANTGNYYVTPEMSRELKHITHGVEHVNLDQDFLATSREWAQKCGPERTHLERAGKSLTFSEVPAHDAVLFVLKATGAVIKCQMTSTYLCQHVYHVYVHLQVPHKQCSTHHRPSTVYEGRSTYERSTLNRTTKCDRPITAR